MRTKTLKIKKNKLGVIFLMLLLIFFQYITVAYAEDIGSRSIDNAIIFVSILSVVSLCIEIILWKKLTGEIFSPFIIFLIVLFIFCLGQTIGWSFGIEMGPKDWWPRDDHGMNHKLIFNGIVYSLFSISLFFLGAIFGEKITSNSNKKIVPDDKNNDFTLKVFSNVGKKLLFIAVPAFIINTYFKFSLVLKGGYSELYVEQTGSTIIQTIITIISDLYQPALLLLLISNKDNKKNQKIILFFMLLDVFIDLFIGGRSGAVMTIIGILIAYHYFIKPISKTKVIYGSILGYLGMAVLNTVAIFRGVINKSFSNLILTFMSCLSNVFGTFIGELGWNLSSICWTMNLVPSSYPFRYGMSYIVSFISWVPSFIFGGKQFHPTVIHANLGDWLQNALGMSYGPGYTMIAESFINFGWFGILIMFIEGIFVAKFIAKIKRKECYSNVFEATFQIVFIMTIMKALVRSSFSVAIRTYLLNVLPLYLILKFALNKRKNA